MQVYEMDYEDAGQAVRWITERIRITTGNDQLEFDGDWLPMTGLSAYDDRMHLKAVAILYLEKNSPVAVCGWCVANPENSIWQSREAVRLLMEKMPYYAKSQGAKYLMSMFGNRGINHILDGLDYINSETCETKFMKLR